jgi:hypothetical protein
MTQVAQTSFPTPRPTPRPTAKIPAAVTATATILHDVTVRIGIYPFDEALGILPAGSVVSVAGLFPNDRLALQDLGWVTYDPASIQLSVPLATLTNTGFYPQSMFSPWYTPGQRTGVAIVDDVIGLVERGDAEGLSKLAVNRDVPCIGSTDDSRNGPRCPAGVAIGTPLSKHLRLACEGDFVDEARLSEVLSVKEPRLFGVGKSSAPDSAYRLIFTGLRDRQPFSFALSMAADGRVTTTHVNCGPSSMLGGIYAWLLPPLKPPQLR